MKKLNRISLAIVIAAIVTTQQARAAVAGTAMPWEGPLTMIKNSLTGPVAMSVSIIAFVVTGLMLLWGSELEGIAKKIVAVVFAASIAASATTVYLTIFATNGALLVHHTHAVISLGR